MNLGDEAILEGILGQLRATIPADVTVFSRNPEDTLARHKVERAVSTRARTRREMIPEIEQLDLFDPRRGRDPVRPRRRGVHAGGVHRQRAERARHALRDQRGPPRDGGGPAGRAERAERLAAAGHHGARPAWGIGSSRTSGSRPRSTSPRTPRSCSSRKSCPDDALEGGGRRLRPTPRRLLGPGAGARGAGHRPEEYYALLANAADFVVKRYDANVLFVPMEKTDVQHSHAVVAHMQNAERAEVLRRRYSPRQILDLMGHFEFAVGMRLHFLIFAALRGTPFAALPYASKVTGLLEDLEMPTPPLGNIGIGQLIARIDRSWDTRAEIRAKLSERVPALRTRAQQTNELLLRAAQGTRAGQAVTRRLPGATEPRRGPDALTDTEAVPAVGVSVRPDARPKHRVASSPCCSPRMLLGSEASLSGIGDRSYPVVAESNHPSSQRPPRRASSHWPTVAPGSRIDQGRASSFNHRGPSHGHATFDPAGHRLPPVQSGGGRGDGSTRHGVRVPRHGPARVRGVSSPGRCRRSRTRTDSPSNWPPRRWTWPSSSSTPARRPTRSSVRPGNSTPTSS